MPVDARRHAQAILDMNIKRVALFECEAVGSRSLDHAVARGCLAGDFDLARFETKDSAPSRLLRAGRAGRERNEGRERARKQCSTVATCEAPRSARGQGRACVTSWQAEARQRLLLAGMVLASPGYGC